MHLDPACRSVLIARAGIGSPWVGLAKAIAFVFAIATVLGLCAGIGRAFNPTVGAREKRTDRPNEHGSRVTAVIIALLAIVPAVLNLVAALHR
jgi:Na+(H+)/acetate symporter ActP